STPSSLALRPPPRSPLFPYTTLFRSPRRAEDAPLADDPRHTGHVLRGDLGAEQRLALQPGVGGRLADHVRLADARRREQQHALRSEEHTSELQSRFDLVCRLLLEKKK